MDSVANYRNASVARPSSRARMAPRVGGHLAHPKRGSIPCMPKYAAKYSVEYSILCATCHRLEYGIRCWHTSAYRRQ
jgi:hypothetical protein